MRSTLIALLLFLAACGEQPSTQPAASGPSAASPGDGVAVVLTGVPVVAEDRTVEWCSPVIAEEGADQGAHGANVSDAAGHNNCPGIGIPIAGLANSTIDAFDQPLAWRIEGIYDGMTVRATSEPKPVKPAEYADIDLTTPCTDLRRPSSSATEEAHPLQIDPAVRNAVNRYLATIPDRYAAQWWDGANSVLNFLLTGNDVTAHRAALEEAVGTRAGVCVVGGAHWSYNELRRAQQRASVITYQEGMGLISNGKNSIANRVELDVHCSDEATVNRIHREAGNAVHVRSFLAVRNGTLDDVRARAPTSELAARCARTPNPIRASEPGASAT